MCQEQQPPLEPSPIDPAIIANPYPEYQKLRDEKPVYWNDEVGAWIITRYSDVVAALRDPRLSADSMSSLLSRVPEPVKEKILPLSRVFSDMMLMSDPPNHTRLRALANQAFTPRVVEGMRSNIQAIVDELLDAVYPKGKMNVIADLAYPLPAIVISQMLGVEPEDRDQFKKWSDDLAAFLGNVRTMAETAGAALQSALEMTAYFKTIVAQRRQYARDDLISALAAAEEPGDMFSEAELYSMCILLLFAGHETTTNLIGNGLLALLQNPDQLQQLKSHPSMIEGAVEEFLRYDSPVQSTARIAMENMELGGNQISRGERISIGLGSANRDPAQFPDPDRLDIARKHVDGSQNRHLGFGFGAHFCLGSALARMEGRIAINAVLLRMPNIRLQSEDLEWRDNPVFRGLKSLNITF